jgi:hypothetical protein
LTILHVSPHGDDHVPSVIVQSVGAKACVAGRMDDGCRTVAKQGEGDPPQRRTVGIELISWWHPYMPELYAALPAFIRPPSQQASSVPVPRQLRLAVECLNPSLAPPESRAHTAQRVSWSLESSNSRAGNWARMVLNFRQTHVREAAPYSWLTLRTSRCVFHKSRFCLKYTQRRQETAEVFYAMP